MNIPLSLSQFTHARASNDVRLQIVENEHKYTYCAAEKLGSRIVSWFGKWPIFQLTSAVKNHVENIKAQDTLALQAFTSALSEKYSDDTIKVAMASLGFEVSEKPLTKRTVNAIIGFADIADASEKFRTKMLLEAMVKGLTKNIEDLKQLTGASLKANFHSLSTEAGALRSIRTFTGAGLSKIPEAKVLEKYIQTLNNIEVGGVRFSNWGTIEGAAQKFVEEANDRKLDLAANKIKAIARDIGELLPMIKMLEKDLSTPIPLLSGPKLGLSRFGDNIPVNPHTQVVLKDGTPMPVNVLSCDGKEVALAGSYPKDSSLALEAHMKMLLEKECSCLVVLTPESQMQAKNLPAYFTQGKRGYGEVAIDSKLNTAKSDSKGRFDVYDLKILSHGQMHSLPVVHVKNWEDHKPLKSHEELASLAYLVKDLQNDSIYEVEASGTHLPMIHCLGGVGRTGTLSAAMELLQYPSKEIGDIVQQFIDSRNARMIEDSSHREQLQQMKDFLLT